MQQIVFCVLCAVASATCFSISGSFGIGNKSISADGSISFLPILRNQRPSTNDQSNTTASQNSDGRRSLSIWGGLDRGRPVFGSNISPPLGQSDQNGQSQGPIFDIPSILGALGKHRPGRPKPPNQRPQRPRPRPTSTTPSSAVTDSSAQPTSGANQSNSSQSTASTSPASTTVTSSSSSSSTETSQSSSSGSTEANSSASSSTTEANSSASSSTTEANSSASSSTTEATQSGSSTSSTTSSPDSTMNILSNLNDRILSRQSRQSGLSGLSAVPNLEDLISMIPNVSSPSNINIPNISLPSISSMPQVPGLSDALTYARNHVLMAIGGGADLADGIHRAMDRALSSDDAPGAIRQLLNTILDAYDLVARNCPLIAVGSLVLQEGIRIATEIAEALSNISIEGGVTISI